MPKDEGDYLEEYGMGINDDNPHVARLQTNERYSIGFDFMHESSDDELEITVKWYQSREDARSDIQVSECNKSINETMTESRWQQYTLTCDVPDNAEYMRLFITASSGYVDNVFIRKNI